MSIEEIMAHTRGDADQPAGGVLVDSNVLLDIFTDDPGGPRGLRLV